MNSNLSFKIIEKQRKYFSPSRFFPPLISLEWCLIGETKLSINKKGIIFH